jgi:hypothetical protein
MTLMTVLCGGFLSAGLRLDSPRRFQGGRAIPSSSEGSGNW